MWLQIVQVERAYLSIALRVVDIRNGPRLGCNSALWKVECWTGQPRTVENRPWEEVS